MYVYVCKYVGMYVCMCVCVYVCVCMFWYGKATSQLVVAEGHNYMKFNIYSQQVCVCECVCVPISISKSLTNHVFTLPHMISIHSSTLDIWSGGRHQILFISPYTLHKLHFSILFIWVSLSNNITLVKYILNIHWLTI